MKKLGDLLEKRMEEEDVTPMKRLKREAQENGSNAVDNLNFVVSYFENIKKIIYKSISKGQSIPEFIVGKTPDSCDDYSQNRINALLSPHTWTDDLNSYYKPIWDELVEWGKSENLNLTWVKNVDGGGMTEWFELNVAPAPKPKMRPR